MGTHTHTIQTKLEGKHGPTDCIYCWWRISQTSEAFSSSAVRVCLAVWNIEVSKVLGVPSNHPRHSTMTYNIETYGDLGISHFMPSPYQGIIVFVIFSQLQATWPSDQIVCGPRRCCPSHKTDIDCRYRHKAGVNGGFLNHGGTPSEP